MSHGLNDNKTEYHNCPLVMDVAEDGFNPSTLQVMGPARSLCCPHLEN